jgi:hypothetical protein
LAFVLALVATAGVPAGSAQALSGGAEIPVNTTTAGGQSASAIADLTGGGFVVAWTSDGEEGATAGVFARRFDAAGAPLGGEIPVSGDPVGQLTVPDVAADPGGGFTVVWNSVTELSSDILARRYDSAGTALGGAITIDSTDPQSELDLGPNIAADGSGGFTVAWSGLEIPVTLPFMSNVYARRFDSAGAPLGAKVQVNVTTEKNQGASGIVSDGSGGFTVVWASSVGGWWGIPESDVFVRRFDSDATPLSGEIQVDESAGFAPSIAPAPSGAFTVAFSSGGIHARRFDSSGSPLGDQIAVDEAATYPPISETSISADPGGGFTVAWTLAVPEPYPGDEDVYARRFNASGAPLAGRVRVNVSTAADQFSPDLAPDGNGYFTAVWTSAPERTGGEGDIYARRFGAGPETQIDAGPADGSSTNDPTPAFGFSADEQGASFECRLDSGAFAPCSSPQVTDPLADGPHAFEVKATANGQTDLSPARRQFTVDTVPPDTAIDSGPSGLTNNVIATFAFSSEPGASFECRLDGGAFAPCSSPFVSGAMTDGSHSFEVRGVDSAGNADPAPALRAFTVDTIPPQVAIDSGPSGPTNDATPSFSFSAGEAGVSFECMVGELEGGGSVFSPCSSPFTADPLADGSYLFAVLAWDAAGNTGKIPRLFSVDTVAPDTAIVLGPPLRTNDATPTFVFSASEPGASFECRLDGGAYLPCGVPFTAEPLADGAHSLNVRAVDEASNVDPSPAAQTFTIHTGAPETSIDSGPSDPTNDATPSFSFSSSEPGSTFECRLDGGAFSACKSPLTVAPLPDGRHSFEVRALDEAANPDPDPALRGFVVDTRAPVAALSAQKLQPVGEPILVRATCREDCTVEASGKVSAAGRGFDLKGVKKRLAAGETGALRLRASRTAWRKLGQLLAVGRRARAAVKLTLTDSAGNPAAKQLTIRLRSKQPGS